MNAGQVRKFAVAVGLVEVLTLIVLVVLDRIMVRTGHPELASLHGEAWVILVGICAATVVGFAIARSQPAHPVGWLFLALSGAMLLSAALDTWVDWGHRANPGSLPGTRVVAVAGDASFILWLVLVALVLLLTPTGTFLSARWRVLARIVVFAGAASYALAMVSARTLSAPYEDIVNPWAIHAIQPAADWISYVTVLMVGVGLVVSGFSILLRWRRSRGDDRRQLLWLALVVVPLPIFVIAAFVTGREEAQTGTLIATGGFVVLVPVAAGLSVSRYHLYDVERLVAATATYVLLSVVLVFTYTSVVWLGARGAQEWSVSPTLAATLGAVIAVGISEPVRRGIQNLIDRRFRRRQHEAKQMVRAGLANENAGLDVEALFRRALGDPTLDVAYPPSESGEWVSGFGLAVRGPATAIRVSHHGREVARVGFDPSRNDAATVHEVTRLAAAELDNGRLRAALAQQIAEISASRHRLAEAQRTERRRIERDLHDGAQQRLLALAMELRSAHLSGNTERMRQALTDGATSAQSAVRELRELANGLHPAALLDGGLSAAIDDLARHYGVDLRRDVSVPRLDPALEFTAWLVILEALVNVQKHAQATRVSVDVHRDGPTLRIRVCDNGGGGARSEGPGLRGMQDRVEAAGGEIVIFSPRGAGTTIDVALPCAS